MEASLAYLRFCNNENHQENTGSSQEHLLENMLAFCAKSMLNLWRIYDEKLRRITLLHFGLVTSRFGYCRHFYDFVISGRVPDSPDQLFLFLEAPANNSRKTQIKTPLVFCKYFVFAKKPKMIPRSMYTLRQQGLRKIRTK